MAAMSKKKLQYVCILALNHMRRNRPVRSVILARCEIGNANWTLQEVKPRLDISDARRSYAVIRALQSQFQMDN
jgi:hypothetical protein